jgi:hypothetical protein
MKLLKSDGGPTVIFATSDRSRSLNPDDQSEDETYSRDNAEHFCPAHTPVNLTPHSYTQYAHLDTQSRLEWSAKLHFGSLQTCG